MDLALATGHGPALLAGGSLVRAEDAVAFGFRDGEESAREGSQPLPDDLLALDLSEVRSRGAEEAARRAVTHLTRPGGPERFWIHVDADVLDDAVMPAVDYRLPGGLSPGELTAVLRVAMATGAAYLGLRSYRWIGIAWLLHTSWDVVHHLYGNPIWPWMPLSSVGCAVLDAVIAVWFLAGAPSVVALVRREQAAAR